MHFCSECGRLLPPGPTDRQCQYCDPAGVVPRSRIEAERVLPIEGLSSTKSGHILKEDALPWLEAAERPSVPELKRSILPKPKGFRGRSLETDISDIRVSGDARFVQTFAGLISALADFENDETRVELGLKRTKAWETKRYTGNYALYVSVAERGT